MLAAVNKARCDACRPYDFEDFDNCRERSAESGVSSSESDGVSGETVWVLCSSRLLEEEVEEAGTFQERAGPKPAATCAGAMCTSFDVRGAAEAEMGCSAPGAARSEMRVRAALHSLLRLLRRWCSQMLLPPHSLHVCLWRWCSQMLLPPHSLQSLLRRWWSQMPRPPHFLH